MLTTSVTLIVKLFKSKFTKSLTPFPEGRDVIYEHYYCNKRVLLLTHTLKFTCMLKILHARFAHMYIT